MSKLIPIEFKNQRIMTTKVLAEEYGATEKNIQDNFSNNKNRFVEGKHYFKLEGQQLKEFKNSLPDNIGEPLKFAPVLYLWTDRGAARHAKILDTDEAWEVYEALEETYFRVKEQKQLSAIDQLRLQYQVIESHEEKLNKLDNKVEVLSLTMNINDGQAKTIQKLVHKRVKILCCGDESIAYCNQNLRKKVYKHIWKTLKDYLNVTVYHNILRKDYASALRYIDSITLQGALLREVQEANNQILIKM